MNLKIFNLNCWLLPPPLSIQNKRRVQKIVGMIKSYRPDIIALQEVWLNRYVQTFAKALPGYNFITSDTKFFNKTGLVTGIKNKPTDHKVNYFKILPGYSKLERSAQKGYHLINLRNNLSFINTHLYTPTSPSEKLITISQFQQLQNYSNYEQIIISGDINVDEPELKEINRYFKYDRSGGNTISPSNPLTRSRFNKYGVPKQRVDYLLCPNSDNVQVNTVYEKKTIVSDHYALLSELEIK